MCYMLIVILNIMIAIEMNTQYSKNSFSKLIQNRMINNKGLTKTYKFYNIMYFYFEAEQLYRSIPYNLKKKTEENIENGKTNIQNLHTPLPKNKKQ